MRTAYKEDWLINLHVLKEARRWYNAGILSKEEWQAIGRAYPCGFYHPNLIIRVLLFAAAVIALSGVTGLLSLMVADSGEYVLKYLVLVYGLGSFVFLDRIYLISSSHYKSGVTEAILYHSILFTLIGCGWILEMKTFPFTLCCLLVFTWSAWRYVDLISTACAVASLAYLVFYMLYQAGDWMQQLIPIVMMAVFTPFYFFVKQQKKKVSLEIWHDALTLSEALALLLIYAAGNYMVVRELSVSMLGLELADGQDIPLAIIFYVLTAAVPIAYAYFGIRLKDIVLLRVSLLVLAYTVFTFKYYFSTGHHEITFTVGGGLMLFVSIYLLRFLKEPRHGFTRENILPEEWGNANVQAFIVSQTLGGNKMAGDTDLPGGGTSGGGGSTDSF